MLQAVEQLVALVVLVMLLGVMLALAEPVLLVLLVLLPLVGAVLVMVAVLSRPRPVELVSVLALRLVLSSFVQELVWLLALGVLPGL